MEIPQEDLKAVPVFLNELGYAYREETANPAYEFFLGPLSE
jgi:hypothetical protein